MKWLGLIFRGLAFFLGAAFFLVSCLIFKLGMGCLSFVLLALAAAMITWAVLPLFRENP